MELHSFTLGEKTKPHELFAAISQLPYSLFFDSADPGHPLSRYSYILFHPVETIEAKNGLITITDRQERKQIFQDNPLNTINRRMEQYASSGNCPFFQGGAAGYFGYDLGRGFEKLPTCSEDNLHIPDMAMGIYDQVYVYDQRTDTASFLVHGGSRQQAETRYKLFLKLAHKRTTALPSRRWGISWRASHTKSQYEKAVQEVIDYIHAGDIFQANLSQRFEAELPESFDAWAHYEKLRTYNPAPFSGFLNFGRIKLASTSPERFLSLSESKRVETRPIKGTARRDEDDDIDKLLRCALESSVKDRAENTMIVDLLRNDLSKVCEDSSINVPVLCALESFASVHHLVSVVHAVLRKDKKATDLLGCCFPGGSITGAPKIRAMEIIEELEQKRRGPYCGAMGYIGFNGTMDTNIAIRTLIYEGNKVSFNVGGGIVADSEPDAEYRETMNKAEAIFGSFDHERTQLPASGKI